MNNTIAFTGHQNRFPVTTTTTTTTRSYGPTPQNYCNGSNGYNPANCNGGINLSSKAQMLMRFMGMMSQMMGGPFGELMNALGVTPGGQQGQMQPFSNAHPGFGQPRNAGIDQMYDAGDFQSQMQDFNNQRMMQADQTFLAQESMAAQQRLNQARMTQQAMRRARAGNCNPACNNKAASALDNSKAPQAPGGRATEMKAGQTMKAPNGSLVSWGQDGTVGIKYKDPNGQVRTIDVKNGMLSMDGGKPQKLENVGQLLKLPNGDVVGLGNNPQGPNGKQLCRVVLANNVDQVKTDPASATNIYDIKNMQHTETGIIPTRLDMNFNSSSFQNTPWGPSGNNFSASISMFTGQPYSVSHVTQELLYNTRK